MESEKVSSWEPCYILKTDIKGSMQHYGHIHKIGNGFEFNYNREKFNIAYKYKCESEYHI